VVRWRLVLYLVILAVALSAARGSSYRSISDRFAGTATAYDIGEVKIGDDPAWATEEVPGWTERLLYDLPTVPTIWIRKTVDLLPPAENNSLAIYISLLAAHEVYWDGALIGRNGTIGPDGRAMAAGPLDNFYAIDPSMASPGPHTLAIRAAPGVPRLDGFFHAIAIGETVPMIRSRIRSQLVPTAGLGVFFVVGAYFFSIWLATRRERDALFAILCFASALLVLAEMWRWVFGITWDMQFIRLNVIAALTFAVAWLLPLFFVTDLRIPHRKLWAAASAAILVVCLILGGSFDVRCLLMFTASIVISSAAVVEAVLVRRSEVLPAAIGLGVLTVSLARGGYGFSDSMFFVAFAVLVTSILASMAIGMKRQKREHESALLRAARLEIELLRKSIQPHFLMNTLTAVMEWLEEDPPAGLRFLQSLAEELRILGEVANEKLISVRRELELCRSHLEVMACRKGTKFELATEGIDLDASVPPATFHTLLENAITHNRYEGELVTFTLLRVCSGGVDRYTLETPLRTEAGGRGEGLGHRYIRTRLEESFPGRWSLEAVPVGSIWRTVIEVPSR
jgi:hypothetical protein